MKKLTREQWEQLDCQWARTPPLNDSFAASGEHYILVGLLNKLGFQPHGLQEAMRLAETLLCHGYKKDS